MHSGLKQLLDSNRLEQLDTNLYRGRADSLPSARIYGGQVLAQAISAAGQTVEPRFQLHSMHAYFLRPGDPARGVIYPVDPIRDGRSFCTRRVVARQQGKAIFSSSLSYQVEGQGPVHQAPMPDVPGPEGLVNDSEIYREFVPEGGFDWPLEFRQVEPMDLKQPAPLAPVSHTWFRAADAVPDEPSLHQQLLAYASDNPILVTALRPHGISHMDGSVQVITLDHALWFHRPLRVDDWLLYEVHSDFAGNGRALCRGRIYNRAGELVASAMQEGLVRPTRE